MKSSDRATSLVRPTHSGSAAAHCGKPLAFRSIDAVKQTARLSLADRVEGIRAGKAEPYRTA